MWRSWTNAGITSDGNTALVVVVTQSQRATILSCEQTGADLYDPPGSYPLWHASSPDAAEHRRARPRTRRQRDPRAGGAAAAGSRGLGAVPAQCRRDRGTG